MVLGSVVSRAITGQAPFGPTLVAAATLVALHWAFAWLSFRAGWFGTLVKGSPRTLVEDGAIQWDAMRQSHLSRDDLLSALRSEGRIDDLAAVRCARLERSGSVSVLKKRSPRRVVEVDVASGVQRVRVEFDA